MTLIIPRGRERLRGKNKTKPATLTGKTQHVGPALHRMKLRGCWWGLRRGSWPLWVTCVKPQWGGLGKAVALGGRRHIWVAFAAENHLRTCLRLHQESFWKMSKLFTISPALYSVWLPGNRPCVTLGSVRGTQAAGSHTAAFTRGYEGLPWLHFQ